ncbi:MAG: 16S rRNA (uracil(1498)-N(3))-methyltransferase, partial [Phycisphaerae bacterium]|nr:16S rRNA (uracil(1498)-N(3))-methyltransferase [Phycisphaerae bacterium]
MESDNVLVIVHRCFCEQIRSGRCDLSPEESHHIASVLRMRVGETLELFDGQGTVAEATISRVARKSVCVEVAAPRVRISQPYPILDLYVAVPKGDRRHMLVEKCTELGVNTIQPLITERSVVKPDATAVSRWHRYAVEACKQSRQAWLPQISPPVAFYRSIEARHPTALNLIASPHPDARPLADALRDSRPLTHLAVWVGPEGGFTVEEFQTACAAGLLPVSLGVAVLRIETAAIALAAAVRL